MNLQPGNHQEDYPQREVEAARRVMTELWQVLGAYRDAMVLIGGWVPDLLLPTAIPPHTGSLDLFPETTHEFLSLRESSQRRSVYYHQYL